MKLLVPTMERWPDHLYKWLHSQGTWTPALTFATVGNLSVAYTTQLGWWKRQGNFVYLEWSIVTSTFTHTTAAGELRLTGLPFTTRTATNYFPIGTCTWGGINKANYTQIVPYCLSAGSYMLFRTSGMGQAAADVVVADVPTGGTVTNYGTIEYEV